MALEFCGNSLAKTGLGSLLELVTMTLHPYLGGRSIFFLTLTKFYRESFIQNNIELA